MQTKIAVSSAGLFLSKLGQTWRLASPSHAVVAPWSASCRTLIELRSPSWLLRWYALNPPVVFLVTTVGTASPAGSGCLWVAIRFPSANKVKETIPGLERGLHDMLGRKQFLGNLV